MEIALTHLWDPLGALPVLSGWAQFNGSMLHGLHSTYGPIHHLLYFESTPYQVVSLNLNKELGAHFFALAANNYIMRNNTKNIAYGEAGPGDLIRYGEDDYTFAQYLQFYYQQTDLGLESDLRLYRVPLTDRWLAKHFVTHGIQLIYTLAYGL